MITCKEVVKKYGPIFRQGDVLRANDTAPEVVLNALGACQANDLARRASYQVVKCATLDNADPFEFVDQESPAQKPRTKVEYVKCEFDKLSDLVLFVESENKPYTKGCDFCEVGGMHDAIRRYGLSQQLYRRTEVEISERDLFIEEIGKLIPEFDKRTNKIWIGKIYDSGKFKLID